MEAKTSITACYAVWCLIHDPSHRILIVSAGGSMAKEISSFCIQIINGMDLLGCLRGDTSRPGTRASVEAYDVHHDLKGVEKSPSIACVGITSNMQGKRADLLISDDCESSKNAYTETTREQLRQLTRDFVSICSKGRIVYLGTPQTRDSIYNTLPQRGFTVRIWPGRFPTGDQIGYYGEYLAPFISSQILKDPSLQTGGGLTGKEGQPSDPGMFDEDSLCKKELDQGKSYFTLQHMLNTQLSDADRYPLKTLNLIFHDLDPDTVPGKFLWGNDDDLVLPNAVGSILTERFLKPSYISDEMFEYTHRIISIDPAGGGKNGDATGYAVLFVCNGYIFCMEAGGLPGGIDENKMVPLVEIMQKWNIHEAVVEKNFGHGAYANVLRSLFMKMAYRAKVNDAWATGQKETRIIDTLEPVTGMHKLIFNKHMLQSDIKQTERFPTAQRPHYQLFYQFSRITRDRGCLQHEDVLDSLAQGVDYLQEKIKLNADKAIFEKKRDKLMDFMSNPNGLFSRAHAVMKQKSRAPLTNRATNRCGVQGTAALNRFKGRR
jgi:hypothetical protein